MRLGKAGNCRSARTARARSGASIEELPSATGWLPHTTRAALTGLLKRGYTAPREGKAEGGSVYRVTGVARRARPADAQEEHEQAAGLAGCRGARSRTGPHRWPWPRRTSGALADNGQPRPAPGAVARHAGPHAAYKLPEQRLGKLNVGTRKLLDRLARGGSESVWHLKVGIVMVRERT